MGKQQGKKEEFDFADIANIPSNEPSGEFDFSDIVKKKPTPGFPGETTGDIYQNSGTGSSNLPSNDGIVKNQEFLDKKAALDNNKPIDPYGNTPPESLTTAKSDAYPSYIGKQSIKKDLQLRDIQQTGKLPTKEELDKPYMPPVPEKEKGILEKSNPELYKKVDPKKKTEDFTAKYGEPTGKNLAKLKGEINQKEDELNLLSEKYDNEFYPAIKKIKEYDKKVVDGQFTGTKEEYEDYKASIDIVNRTQQGVDDINSRREEISRTKKSIATEEYKSKLDQGSFLGKTWNDLVDIAGEVSAAATGLVIDAGGVLDTAKYGSVVSDARNKALKKEILPGLRGSMKEVIGDKSVSDEYSQKFNEGFWGGAWSGVIKSIPPMLTPGMSGMLLQAMDGVDKEMSGDEFKGISEHEKMLLKIPLGIAAMTLEKYGFKNLKNSTPIVKAITLAGLKKLPKDATKEQIENVLETETRTFVGQYGKAVASGALAEYETGFGQELADITLKGLFNVAEGKDLFKNPDSLLEVGKQANRAGAQEAVGGGIMVQPFAIAKAMETTSVGKLTNDTQYKMIEGLLKDPNYHKAFSEILDQQVKENKVSAKEATNVLNKLQEAQQIATAIPDHLPVAEKRQVFDLLTEKSKLEKENVLDPRIEEINAELEKINTENPAVGNGENKDNQPPITPEKTDDTLKGVNQNQGQGEGNGVAEDLKPLEEQARSAKDINQFTRDIITDHDVRYINRKAATPLVKEISVDELDKIKPEQKVEEETVKTWEGIIQEGKKPFVIIRENGEIDGHHKLQAYKNLGHTDIPVLYETDLIDFYNKTKNDVQQPGSATNTNPDAIPSILPIGNDKGNGGLPEVGTANADSENTGGVQGVKDGEAAVENSESGLEKQDLPPVEPPVAESKPEGKGKKAVKSLYKNLIEFSNFPEETKKNAKDNLHYNRFTDGQADELAKKLIEEIGIDEAISQARKSDSPLHGAVRVMVLANAINDTTHRYDKAATQEEKDDILDEQSDLLNELEQIGREFGQGIQKIGKFYKATEVGIELAKKKVAIKWNEEQLSKMSPNNNTKKINIEDASNEGLDKAKEEAAEDTVKSKTIEELQKKLDELEGKVKRLEEIKSTKERAKKKVDLLDKRAKLKKEIDKEDWFDNGKQANSSLIPFIKPFNAKKLQLLGDLAKNHLQEKAYTVQELYDKIMETLGIPDNIKEDFQKQLEESKVYENAQVGIDKKVAKDINEELKNKGIKLKDLVESHYENKQAKLEDLKKDLIDKLGLTGSEAEVYAKKITDVYNSKLKEKAVQLLKKTLDPKVLGFKRVKQRDVDRIVAYINQGGLDNKALSGIMYDNVGLINVNEKGISDKFKEYARKIHRSPTGALKNKAETDMLNYIALLKKDSRIKQGVSVAYANMLYSYETHIRNGLFNLGGVITKLGALAGTNRKYAGLIFGSALNSMGYVNYKSLLSPTKLYNNKWFGKAGLAFRDTYKKGYKDDGATGVQTPNEIERFWPIFKAIYEPPLKMLSATDMFFNTPLTDAYQKMFLVDNLVKKKMEANKSLKEVDARREAVKEVGEYFDYSGQKYQEAIGQATHEIQKVRESGAEKSTIHEDIDKPLFIETNGKTERNPVYKDKKYNDVYRDIKRRAFEILEQQRDKDGNVTKDSKDWANEALFMGKPKGTAGVWASNINSIANDHPIFKVLVIPFVNVPLNSANFLIDNSPIGLLNDYGLKPLFGKFGKESLFHSDKLMKRKGLDENISPQKQNELLLRQTLGIAVMAGIYGLMQADYDDEEEGKRPIIRIWGDITGDYQDNASIKQGKMGPDGKWNAPQEWTIDIMGQRFNYKSSVFAPWLAPMGMYSDNEEWGNPNASKVTKSLILIYSYMALAADMSAVSGLAEALNTGNSNFAKAVQSGRPERIGEDVGKKAAKALQNVIIPASGLVRAANNDIEGILNMDDNKANEWYEYVFKDLPGIEEMNATRFDHFGRPIKDLTAIPGIWNGQSKTNPEYTEFNKYRYKPNFYKEMDIADGPNGEIREMSRTEISELNQIRGEIALDIYDKKIDKELKDLDKILTTTDQDKHYKDFMDGVFEEATGKAKLEMFFPK